MKKYKHYLNKKYVTEDKLLISPRDLGFMRSYAVFTKIKTCNGKLFKLKEHLLKLLKSAELINLKHDYNLKKLTKVVKKTIKVNKDEKEKTLKIILSGGISNTMHQSTKANLIIIVDPLKPRRAEIYTKGVKINLIKFTRYLPEAKSTDYIEGVKQTQIGIKNNFFEPIYYSDKQVYECSNSNIFIVKNRKMYTPKNNVYPGILRGVLLHDLKNQLQIKEVDFDIKSLLNADEIFITGSGKEIVPVIKVDKHVIGHGKVGEVTKFVIKTLKEFKNSGKW
jgi:branched-subunit amino acid aminotransferase/4-amino-4-deoxychorismate lyase